MQNCPCGSTKNYDECCGPFISGSKLPETPEELMRSRYTAFTEANVVYIQQTMLPPALENFDVEEARTWATSVEWQRLEIKYTSVNEDRGFVEFIAHIAHKNQKTVLHELSEFKKQDGKWFYVRGVTPQVETYINKNKIGRNDACTCGSGKKYKKCCMLTAVN